MKPNTNQNFTGLAIPLSSNYPILKVTVEKGKKKRGGSNRFYISCTNTNWGQSSASGKHVSNFLWQIHVQEKKKNM